MSYTFESALKALGAEAQVSGGAITVYREGKNIAVSKYTDGVFGITDEGLEVLSNPLITTDDGVEVFEAPKRAGKGFKPTDIEAAE